MSYFLHISCLFSDGIKNFSKILEFASGANYSFTIFLAILFPISSPVVSAVLWNTFLDAVLQHLVLFFKSIQ